MIQDGVLKKLKCGSVIVILVLNVYGLINFFCEVLDGKDVNCFFFGISFGFLVVCVVFVLYKYILFLIDLGLDFYIGGCFNYNYFQICYIAGDEVVSELVVVFGVLFWIVYKFISKFLWKVVWDKYQVFVLVFEGGENQWYDGLSIQYGVMGIC